MKKLWAHYRSNKNKNYELVELGYSSLMWLSGNDPWFCRLWKKGAYNFGESYGKNKFDAYRKALKHYSRLKKYER